MDTIFVLCRQYQEPKWSHSAMRHKGHSSSKYTHLYENGFCTLFFQFVIIRLGKTGFA